MATLRGFFGVFGGEESKDDEGAPRGGLTIDELAAKARVPSRTIRFYQAKGLLPKAELRGRVAYYGEEHVVRLELVQELQDRGLQIRAIKDVVERLDKGEIAVAEWLGLEDQLKAPWADDAAKLLSAAELKALAGGERPGRITELVAAKLVQRHGESFLVPSPNLLAVALDLEQAGVPLEVSVASSGVLAKHLGRAAPELVDLFFSHMDSVADKGSTGDLVAALNALRPAAMRAVALIFAREVQGEIRKRVEEGTATKLSRRRKDA